MTKVYPNTATHLPRQLISEASGGDQEVVLTVWRKSLLFNCEGFTVFDNKGVLVYRVDSYGHGRKAEILLMDAVGKPLLTVRRKKLSLGEQWLVFQGEEGRHPLFSVKKHVRLMHSKVLAQVTPSGSGTDNECLVEGSYSDRCCTIYDTRKRPLAEIKRKEAVGSDVFRLVVQPGFDSAAAMAVVMVLENMFG